MSDTNRTDSRGWFSALYGVVLALCVAAPGLVHGFKSAQPWRAAAIAVGLAAFMVCAARYAPEKWWPKAPLVINRNPWFEALMVLCCLATIYAVCWTGNWLVAVAGAIALVILFVLYIVANVWGSMLRPEAMARLTSEVEGRLRE